MELVGGILCGGLGKRLRPLTDNIPKCLIEIKEGYTILEHQLNKLKNAGIEHVYLMAGYLHEKIRERFGDEWKGVRIEYLVEDRPRGTLYAINSLLDAMKEGSAAIVMNGDVVSDVNIREMVRGWVEGTVSMFITPLTSPYGIIEVTQDNKVVSFHEKPKLPYYINGGVYVIPKNLEKHFKAYTEGDVERLVFPKLARLGLLRSYREEDSFWQSVDSFKDLEAVREEYRNRLDTPWGYEKTITSTEEYVVKVVHVMKGYSTPLHLHKQGRETIYVVKGEGVVKLGGGDLYVKANDVVKVEPSVPHSITALEPLLIHNYSSPHLE
ncbi:MAG: sugar phosphate nucleotidyltransferase [Candidatus Nezhaarchaeota archaeon]|nr:sugar phosphate nucleotidyltransferase [Candidatus Nezhaarchaeota archaeon]